MKNKPIDAAVVGNVDGEDGVDVTPDGRGRPTSRRLNRGVPLLHHQALRGRRSSMPPPLAGRTARDGKDGSVPPWREPHLETCRDWERERPYAPGRKRNHSIVATTRPPAC